MDDSCSKGSDSQENYLCTLAYDEMYVSKHTQTSPTVGHAEEANSKT